MILAICVVVDESKSLSDLGILNNLGASSFFAGIQRRTASAAGQPDNLEIMSMTFAAVIWDVIDPCSVNATRRGEYH